MPQQAVTLLRHKIFQSAYRLLYENTLEVFDFIIYQNISKI